jgi:hypothetical protein
MSNAALEVGADGKYSQRTTIVGSLANIPVETKSSIVSEVVYTNTVVTAGGFVLSPIRTSKSNELDYAIRLNSVAKFKIELIPQTLTTPTSQNGALALLIDKSSSAIDYADTTTTKRVSFPRYVLKVTNADTVDLTIKELAEIQHFGR